MVCRTVSITGARFYAHHGFYEEEKIIGSWYEVDLSVDFLMKKDLSDKLENTIDYQKLYLLIKAEMRDSVDLLETIVENLESKLTQYDIIKSEISVRKENPPLGGVVACSDVKSIREY